VLIPAEESQSVERPAVPSSNVAESSDRSRIDVGSQSIVIAVNNSVSTTTSGPATDPVAPIAAPPPPPNGVVTPQIAIPITTNAQPILNPGSVEPTSPAVQYVAQRERNRRNQFTLAVFLLIAVLILGAVLIWVLRQNAQPPAEKTAGASIHRPTFGHRVVRFPAATPFIAARVQFDIS
jgi:hypothetical protein